MARCCEDVQVMLAALAIASLGGCACGVSTEEQASNQLRLPVATPATEATRQPGEDCTQHSKSICRGQRVACVRYRPDVPGRSSRVCSLECESDAACPTGWACVPLAASLGPGGPSYCFPSNEFEPHAVTVPPTPPRWPGLEASRLPSRGELRALRAAGLAASSSGGQRAFRVAGDGGQEELEEAPDGGAR